MVTIKDVAKKAGVAISTASYALNDDPRVSLTTKKKVLEVAKKLNYHPNAAARNLKRKKTNTVGVFVDGFAGPIYTALLDGIHMALSENDFNIIVTSGESGQKMLLERQVDGAIVIDHNITDKLIKMVADNGLPVIVLDRNLNGNNIYVSTISNESIVYDFMVQMINRGYKEFAYLSGSMNSYDNLHRFKGYCRALSEHQRSIDRVYKGEFTKLSGYQVGRQLIENHEPLPDFIFCANDEMAIGLLDAFHESGIRIPQEVAIAGFDNIDLSSYCNPKLTTIDVKRFDWGKTLAQSMIEILNNDCNEVNFQAQCKIIFRESC